MATAQPGMPAKPRPRTARMRRYGFILGLLIILTFIAIVVIGGATGPSTASPGLGSRSHDGVVDAAERRRL